MPHVKEYEARRATLPHRVEARKDYAQTERGKERLNAGKDAWRKRNPAKYKAHNSVNNAIRDGKLSKKPCAVCGEEKVHAHHEDYSKPLDVVWLCPRHHALHHAEE